MGQLFGEFRENMGIFIESHLKDLDGVHRFLSSIYSPYRIYTIRSKVSSEEAGSLLMYVAKQGDDPQ